VVQNQDFPARWLALKIDMGSRFSAWRRRGHRASRAGTMRARKGVFGDRRGVMAERAATRSRKGGIRAAGSSWIPEDKRLSKVFSKTAICVTYVPSRQIRAPLAVRQRGTERRNAFEMFRPQPGRRVEAEGNFFIWIRCNPLKSPDSAKENQGNASFFSWIYLVLLGFIWTELAARL
jgi:hypothetical protein